MKALIFACVLVPLNIFASEGELNAIDFEIAQLNRALCAYETAVWDSPILEETIARIEATRAALYYLRDQIQRP